MRVVEAVSRALEAAHAKEVVHRDLKPENVIVCLNGTIKVVDFGVAKLRGAAGLTAFNTTVGTVPYMSPEQILGGALDGRTDEFALAAITWEMLSGNTCFGGPEAIPDQALRVLRHEPPPIGTVNDRINEVLQRGLAKDAGDRYPNVVEFVQALGEAARNGHNPSQGAATAQNSIIELPPLHAESTAVTGNDERVDFHTPTAQVDRDFLVPPPARPRITAPSMRVLETTNRVKRPWTLTARFIAIAGGATFGLLLVVIFWLLRR
jgi:serine/threonine-protein kinase